MKRQLIRNMFLSVLFLVSSGGYAFAAGSSSSMPNGSAPNANTIATVSEDDAAIAKTLTTLIHNSKTLSGLGVTFKVDKGIVAYNGTVDSDSEASMLIETAESIIGVNDVNTSDLNVKDSKQPYTDMVISAKIKGLLIKEDLFGDKDVASINTSVETQNGVVYLTGIVDNEQQIKNAVNIIKQSVPGVKKVVYNVRKAAPDTTSSSQSSAN